MLRRLTSIVPVVLAAALLGSCASGTAAPPLASSQGVSAAPSGASPSTVKLQMKSGYTTTSASAAPVWGAKEDGDFDKEGLDVNLTLITSLSTILAAVQTGELPIAIASGWPPVQAALQGGDFVIVGGFMDKVASQIWTIQSIQTPQQLKGKNLGTTALGSAGHVQALVGLEKMGLAKSQVGFVATGAPGETLAAIQAGQIEGAPFTPPENIKARQAGLFMLFDMAPLDIKALQSAIVTTRKYVREHPDVVERYARAMLRGSHRLKTDREFAIQTIGKYTKIEDRPTLEETVDYYGPLWSRDGSPSMEGVQLILNTYQAEPAAKTAKPEQFVDLTFVQRIKSSGFLEQLWGNA